MRLTMWPKSDIETCVFKHGDNQHERIDKEIEQVSIRMCWDGISDIKTRLEVLENKAIQLDNLQQSQYEILKSEINKVSDDLQALHKLILMETLKRIESKP